MKLFKAKKESYASSVLSAYGAGKKKNKSGGWKLALKASVYGILGFGSYQYYTPDTAKNVVNATIRTTAESVTGPNIAGALMGDFGKHTGKQETGGAAPSAGQKPAPKPIEATY